MRPIDEKMPVIEREFVTHSSQEWGQATSKRAIQEGPGMAIRQKELGKGWVQNFLMVLVGKNE